MEANKMKGRKDVRTDRWRTILLYKKGQKKGPAQIGLRCIPVTASGRMSSHSDSSGLRSGWSFLAAFAIILTLAFATMLIIAQPVSAAQLPLPIDAATKAGLPVFVMNNSNIIGDRSDYADIAAGDLDADGDYDMLVGINNGNVEYWRNDGNNTVPVWTLANASVISDNGDAASPTLADFDGDGDFDMYVGYYNGYILYYENTGSPTLPQFTYTKQLFWSGQLGYYILPLAIDYNKDGNIDLYYGRNDPNVYKLKNDVDESSFDFRDFMMADTGQFSSVSLVDIDADGDGDAFVGSGDGKVYLFKNLGGKNSGVFDTVNKDFWDRGTLLFTVGSRADVAAADLDGDGDFDLIIGKGDGTLTYYRNDGTARNAFWTLVPGFFTMDAGDNAAAGFADLDADGDLDMALGNNAGFTAYYQNQGTAQTQNFVLQGTSLVGDVGTDANPEFRDLNNDGTFDLAVGRSDGFVQFFKNTGSPSSYAFTAEGNVLDDYLDYSTPSFADLDGDGDFDLAVGNKLGTISLIKNRGTASNFSFSTQTTFWMENTQRGRTSDFADLDKDKDQDMIIGSEDGYVYYYRNDGNATDPVFTYMRSMVGDWGSWTTPSFGDLNGDGDMDFVMGRSDDNIVRYFRNDVSQSGFNFTLNTSDLIGSVGSYADPKFADMNGDSLLDLIVGSQDGRIRYFKNVGSSGTPAFVSQADLISDQGDYTSISVGDLDADGDKDIVLGESNDPYVRYFRNDGNATVQNFVLSTNNMLNAYCRPGDGNSRCSPELVDIDNDGDLDLLVSNYNGFTRYWRNDGTPSIAVWSDQGDILGDWGTAVGIALADLDDDGTYDFIGGKDDGQIFYYNNEGTAQTANFQYVYAGPGGYQYLPYSGDWAKPEFADLNGDGNVDIAVGNSNGKITLYFNQGHFQTDQAKGDNAMFIAADDSIFDQRCEPDQGTGWCNGELVDIDNDGDLDFIGSNYYYAPRFWENVGTPQVYSFLPRQVLIGDYGDGQDTALGDFDGDGDYDLFQGYDDGRFRYFKNVGTKANASFKEVHRGDSGNNYLPDQGDWSRVGAVDIDNDGRADLMINDVEASVGYQYLLRNRGPFTDPADKSQYPTWIWEGSIFTNPSNYNYNKPSATDLDGDGDTDLVVGDEYARLLYYRNEGTLSSPAYVFDSNLLSIPNYWAKPALVDIDGDGDFDILAGRNDGYVIYATNTGAYRTATTVSLKNAQGQAVVGASVVFSDDSGVVCSNATDSRGQVRCQISYVGNRGKITVSSAAAGTASVGIFSPNSRGSTAMTLQSASATFGIDIARFVFRTYGKDNAPKSMKVEVSDDGVTLFSEMTDGAGFIDGFFPKAYLENRQEPFTQNRIQYDIMLDRNQDYTDDLVLDGVFAPNEVNFNGASEGAKLYKFMSSHQMSTDSEYKGFIIYPALSAQRSYSLEDTVPANFAYTGAARAEYMGKYACQKAMNGTTLNINASTPGCGFLTIPVDTAGAWLKYEFTVRTPSLDYFISHGLTNQSYSFPASQLTLIS